MNEVGLGSIYKIINPIISEIESTWFQIKYQNNKKISSLTL